jgi:type II secretory pathway pseudopilin PulG
MLGVTLLEIMLVLAVASMIIVMSVRYYQSAMANQQANSILQQLQAITAQADILAQATGSYAVANVSMNTLAPLLPGGTANAFVTPWGTTIVIGTPTDSTYPITVPVVPTGVCPLVISKLKQNNHYANVLPTSCAAGSSITYTYKANP